ncbi:hypothetical protein [Pseudomonas urmiensis]|jgi:hypothetical protein|uniref:hypothetical protein n=1 Tax=Pseudomonas urmiensis TaxID=2745493 RepID=UPI003D138388
MSEVIQTVIVVALAFVLHWWVKPYPLRKWLGVALVVLGAVGCIALSQTHLLGFDLGLMASFAVPIGVVLFMTRRHYAAVD